MSQFQIGQDVICINAKNIFNPDKFSSLPIEGHIYKIRSILPPSESEPDWGVCVEEIKGKFCYFSKKEYGFFEWRFGPIGPKKDQISTLLANINLGIYDKTLDKEPNPYFQLEEVD